MTAEQRADLHEQHAAARERAHTLRGALAAFCAVSEALGDTEGDLARRAAMERDLRAAEHTAARLELALAGADA